MVGLLLLSGCDQFPSDDMALQVRGGSMILVLCEPLEGKEVTMQERLDGDWATFYKSFDEFSFSVGDEIVIGGDEGDSLDTTIDRLPSSKEGTDISILLGGRGADRLRGALTIPEGGVPSEGWLRPDGSQSESPCD